MGFNAVHADPENNSLDGLELFDFVTEIECFPRSAGGVVFGIEVENDFFPEVTVQRDLGAVIGIERKNRRFLSDFGHRILLPFPVAGPGGAILIPHGATAD
jgi:hypothetical protein